MGDEFKEAQEAVGGFIDGAGTQGGNLAGVRGWTEAAALAKLTAQTAALSPGAADSAALRNLRLTPNGTAAPGFFGGFGNALSGLGKVVSGEYMRGGMEIAGGVADIMSWMDPTTVSSKIGPGARLGSGVYGAATNYDQCAEETFTNYDNNKCFTGIGDATIAGLELFPPTRIPALVGKFGLDLLGMGAGWIDPSLGFSAGGVVGGVEHAVTDVVRTGYGVGADLAHDTVDWWKGRDHHAICERGLDPYVSPDMTDADYLPGLDPLDFGNDEFVGPQDPRNGPFADQY